MIGIGLTSKDQTDSALARVLPRFSPRGRLQVLAAVFLLTGVLSALLPASAQAYGRVKLEPAAGPAPSSTVLSGSGFPRSRRVVVSGQ
ncbi:MAG: hypothetical protein LC808_08475, partial [Actinobacteria bacterium]|nr:hypothetical protein [Actinomycetota bacterium]